MKEEHQSSKRYVFQRLGHYHQRNKKSFGCHTLPERGHDIEQGRSLGERQVAKVNIKEGITTLKITVVNQGDIEDART